MRPRWNALLEERTGRGPRPDELVLGSRKLYDEFDLDAFLEQYEGRLTRWAGTWRRWRPIRTSPKRVLAMRVFAQSELYKRTAGISPATGLTMSEVDDRVKALMKGDA